MSVTAAALSYALAALCVVWLTFRLEREHSARCAARNELDALQYELDAARATIDMLRHNAIGPHGWELGRQCTVWNRGKWHPGCTVVAVSHKGALAVRDGSRTWWIPKHRAAQSVRFEEVDGE